MSVFNIVELVTAGGDDCAFDQPCKWGHRVEGHAVYCHNEAWDDSPRKCRRTWYTGGEIKDEDCAGFEANPAFKGELRPTPLQGELCSRCHGVKRISTDLGKSETCPLCEGSGEQPSSIELTQYEQNTLEMGSRHTGKNPTDGHPFVCIAENAKERLSIERLCKLNLIVLRSASFANGGVTAYLLENTMKGYAVMKCNWGWKNGDPPER